MTKTILHIETTTNVCSLAVSRDGEVLLHRIDREGHNHARVLPLFVDEALRFLTDKDLKLDAVALSKGPGSYTGLRIGASMAKGICYAQNIPLLGINTLQLMAVSARESALAAGCELLCPMIDARRMEVYQALFSSDLQEHSPVSAQVIDENSFLDELSHARIAFFGNGSDKCSEVISSSNAVFLSGVVPDAYYSVQLAEPLLERGVMEDVAYFEPFYLKEFQATVAKNKVLG
ncbi:MAG: tRNA (adenosine(37)-N6)-threonylcarbamoyltransferase complex dimerization subunit type 1 TsaB [Paludibacteraceae bacterium]|nr:tRNA (adenosine(37)-N6)-threonylcarbamoyltransferase complex dimerization subunit type 1 TsaB [Paludibacteraceae bacterium]